MSTVELRPPTSQERENIYHAFREVLKICYPGCRWIDDDAKDSIYIKFFSEVQIKEDEGKDKEGERAGALYGGLDAEIDDLHLLIDIAGWRASPSERNLLLLIHEATHIEYKEHPHGFWKTLVKNVKKVLDKEKQFDWLPDYTNPGLCVAAVHHPNPHGCDGDWNVYERKQWIVDQLPYPQSNFEQFEELGHPTTNYPGFSDVRLLFEKEVLSDPDEKPAIAFLPYRDGKITNTSVIPGYMEDPEIPEFVLRDFLTDIEERGFPPIPAPVIKRDPSGEYRIVDGKMAAAVAQRIGLLEIGVVDIDQEYETVEKRDLDATLDL